MVETAATTGDWGAVLVDAPPTSGAVVAAGSRGTTVDAPTATLGAGTSPATSRAMVTAVNNGAMLIDAGAALIDAPPAMSGAVVTAGRRGATVDAPTATLGAGATEARRGAALAFNAAATRCCDPCLPDAIELDGLGGGGLWRRLGSPSFNGLMAEWKIWAEERRGRLYGIIMETNVFNLTLFFLVRFSFFPYDILLVPINLGSRVSAFFCKIYHV